MAENGNKGDRRPFTFRGEIKVTLVDANGNVIPPMVSVGRTLLAEEVKRFPTELVSKVDQEAKQEASLEDPKIDPKM